TLMNSSVNYRVQLEINGTGEYQKTLAKFEVTAEIEPRLRFSQTPEIIDPIKGGTAEIEIENLSSVSFKPASLILANTAYEISDYTPAVVAPGKTLKVSIKYQPQPNPLGVALEFVTSPAVLTKPYISFPLNVKLPSSQEPAYTKEQLDE